MDHHPKKYNSFDAIVTLYSLKKKVKHLSFKLKNIYRLKLAKKKYLKYNYHRQYTKKKMHVHSKNSDLNILLIFAIKKKKTKTKCN